MRYQIDLIRISDRPDHRGEHQWAAAAYTQARHQWLLVGVGVGLLSSAVGSAQAQIVAHQTKREDTNHA